MRKVFIICLLSVGYLNCNAQNYVLSPLGIKFPNYTTGTRPAANSLGAGTVLYNSSDNTHQYSNGSSWLNLLGTTSVPSGTANQTLRNNGSGWVTDGLMLNTGSKILLGHSFPFRNAILDVYSNSYQGLRSESVNSIGVEGISSTDVGVRGYSSSFYGGMFYGRVRLKKGGNGDAGIEFENSSESAKGYVGMFGDVEMMLWGYGYNAPIQRWNVNTGQICYASSPTICSDIRLKKDFSNLSNSLQSVSSLQGYNYYLLNEKNTNLHTGFIAQEIQKIFPELVNIGSDGYLSVDYIGLIPHLVESVKSLKSENESLLKRLSKIEELLKISENNLEAKR